MHEKTSVSLHQSNAMTYRTSAKETFNSLSKHYPLWLFSLSLTDYLVRTWSILCLPSASSCWQAAESHGLVWEEMHSNERNYTRSLTYLPFLCSLTRYPATFCLHLFILNLFPLQFWQEQWWNHGHIFNQCKANKSKTGKLRQYTVVETHTEWFNFHCKQLLRLKI